MVLTVGELCTNKNFILKIAVLVNSINVFSYGQIKNSNAITIITFQFEGLFINFLFWPKYPSGVITICECSQRVIITSLLITYIFFESTPATVRISDVFK